MCEFILLMGSIILP